jgi:hypothetical protein
VISLPKKVACAAISKAQITAILSFILYGSGARLGNGRRTRRWRKRKGIYRRDISVGKERKSWKYA